MTAAFDHDADAHRAAVAAHDQRFARLQAALGQAGFDLAAISVNGAAVFVATRWGRSKDFDSLAAAEAWADKVLGVKP